MLELMCMCMYIHIRRCLFVFQLAREGESKFSVNSCFFAVFLLTQSAARVPHHHYCLHTILEF